MPATPERIRLLLNDGVVLSRADPSLKADYANAEGSSAEVESFFDNADDADVILEQRWLFLSEPGRKREQIETSSRLRLGTGVSVVPAAPKIRVVDRRRGLDERVTVRAYSIDYNSERYAIECIGGLGGEPVIEKATFDSTLITFDSTAYSFDEVT